jgi:hypothetical protein
VTGFIEMFDTVWEDQWPDSPQAVLGYVDGHAGDQPDWAWVQQRFPGAYHLSIALNPVSNAMALDVENGAASPASAAAWYERQKARGIQRPCLYASASLMEATVIPVVRAAMIPRESVRLWSAHYTHQPHVCGPASCGATSVQVDGTQWTDRALGRTLDQSLLLPDFFGVPPVPPAPHSQPPTLEDIVSQAPVVKLHDTGQAVRNWQGLLCAHGHAVAIDGSFGSVTDSATRRFQQSKGLTADGEAGPLTLKAALA